MATIYAFSIFSKTLSPIYSILREYSILDFIAGGYSLESLFFLNKYILHF